MSTHETTPEPGTTAEVSSLPDCDIHKYEMNQPGVKAQYDGKTDRGQWGFMCESCFQAHGVGLGLGKGQRLIVAE